MTRGSSLRTPPRWWPAQRAALALCIALLALPLVSGRAEAYPCGATTATRSPSSAAGEDCRRPGTPKREEAGEPNVVSFAVFVAVLVGVLLIPINYSRRDPAEPE